METMVINGVEYVKKSDVKKSDVQEPAKPKGKMPFVIVRASGAGVHAGYLRSREGDECELADARRLWYWKGAKCLSDLATYGPGVPSECRFGTPINLTVLGVCEVIEVTAQAQAVIVGVAEWKYE